MKFCDNCDLAMREKRTEELIDSKIIYFVCNNGHKDHVLVWK